ncbi:hypothetical protein GGI07_001200 [Coemansia sp. Benny D115]|nr:hypothetical protein GGI07_001200 [Coemansia sp. Benny D115]
MRQFRIFRPYQPFFRKPEHRARVLGSLRQLLRLAQQFSDPVEQTYLRSWIRERFHHNKRNSAPKKAQHDLDEAQRALAMLQEALDGSVPQQKHINDLAYGRTGWLKYVMEQIMQYDHPTKACPLIRDTRPQSSQIHQPHKAYRIPLDLRAFSVPEHLMKRIHKEDRKMRHVCLEKRRRADVLRGREIEALGEAVSGGNEFLWQAGLVPGAFSVEPSVLRGPSYVPGVLGNPAWIPPKVSNRMDPPFVQHVRASSGCEFLRINTRKLPHWQSARIAVSYQKIANRVQRHEFYYYFVDDLRLEEEFEERLGVRDRGYWMFARNYRDFLRAKVKTFSLQPDTPEISNPIVELELKEGEDSYQRLLDHAMDLQHRLD